MKAVKLIKVLASFPSDVSDEASLLDSITAELNRTVGDAHGIRFEVINWTRDVPAGTACDVQQVVNKRIEGNYEVIVGTFWTRAGTPTPRAESGSIEEIKAAVSLAKKSGNVPYVLVYFKAGGVDLLRVDLTQISTLFSFREWLTENGVLFKSFQDRSSYEAILRMDLAKIGADLGGASNIELVQPGDIDELVVDDDLGLLDYIDMHESAFLRMADIMADQGKIIERLTENTQNDTAEADQLLTNQFDPAGVRRMLRRNCETLNSFCNESEVKLVELQKATDEAFDALTMSLSLGASSSGEAKAALVQQLRTTIESAREAATSTKSLRDCHSGFPRMTAEHNKAKRRIVDLLDRWSVHFDRSAALADEVLSGVQRPSVGAD